ncbi:MAG: agmatine deiminase family protein [Rickettsiales bacterium]
MISRFLRVPAEWEKQSAIWTAIPAHGDVDRWGPGDRLRRAQQEFGAMVRAIAGSQRVEVFAADAESFAVAKTAFADSPNVRVTPSDYGDIWLRDTGPIFAQEDGKSVALRFKTNGWGNKFVYEHDDAIGDAVANLASVPIRRHDFVLEGGSLEHNGDGVILTTKQCILNTNRNLGRSQLEMEKALKDAFGARRIVWLDFGMENDHTDGHVDNIARFVSTNRVVCQKAFGKDDPNAETFENIAAALREEGFDVTQLPSPGKVTDEDGDVIPASHMNFIIANACVVVPVYGTASQDAALAALQPLFPDRKVVGVRADTILTGGGSFHCITQQQPA